MRLPIFSSEYHQQAAQKMTIDPHDLAAATSAETAPERLVLLARDPALVALVAANPSAPAAVLDALAVSSGDDLLAIVVGNPNTPLATLAKLAIRFPQQFLENPVIPFWKLIEPQFWDQLDVALLLAFLRLPDAPPEIIEIAGSHGNRAVIEASIDHIQRAGEAGADWEFRAKRRVMARPDAYLSSPFEVFIEYGQFFEYWLLEAMADSSNVSTLQGQAAILITPDAISARLRIYANGQKPHIRKNVASHPLVPIDVLASLANDPDSDVLTAVANNERTPIALLTQLADRPEEPIRLAVARHPSASPAVLAQLSIDNRMALRRAVATHPHTPPAVLTEWARDASVELRKAVARNEATPQSVLTDLLFDEAWEVGVAAVNNPMTPTSALERLAQTSVLPSENGTQWRAHPLVVAHNPYTPAMLLEELAHQEDAHVREVVAANPQTPQTVVSALAGDSDVRVRRAIADREQLPESILQQLAGDPDLVVRGQVAHRRDLPLPLLEQLAADREPFVGRMVLRNPHAPLATKHKAAGQQGTERNYRTLIHLWTSLANQPALASVIAEAIFTQALVDQASAHLRHSNSYNWLTQMMVLGAPQCPPHILAEHVTTGDWMGRYAIARNTNTPLSSVVALADDGHRLVRAAARARLIGQLADVITAHVAAMTT